MLKNYYPYEHVKSVFDIDYKKLYALGFRGIIFDIDNTLVHHGDASTPEVDALFKEIHKTGLKTLLLSNNDTERIERFIKNIDTLYIPDADKPSVDGYEKAIRMLGIEKREAVFAGDQIFMDIYGANKCGMANILVDFIKLPGETKIGKKRYIEKLILKIYKHTKYAHRLGNIKKCSNKHFNPLTPNHGGK
ncbi:MAG: HAD-IIIA family hydrolase [Clostridia bacterium]|nr:HAD-IIIA family hydrolase [Clostridia bacterium]